MHHSQSDERRRCDWRVAVVVPAHNEEDLVERCLTSVRVAIDRARVEAWIVLVADACMDDTVNLAVKALGTAGEVFEIGAHNAGAARSAGVGRALATLGSRLEHTWISNTDADTEVPPDWITRQLTLADAGAAGVAGVITVDTFSQHPHGAVDRFEATYERRSDGTHPHVHGANMGIRADAYVDVGGWTARPCGEDHALWQRLRKSDWPTISTCDVAVVTSGRAIGRAVGGFADTLAALTAG